MWYWFVKGGRQRRGTVGIYLQLDFVVFGKGFQTLFSHIDSSQFLYLCPSITGCPTTFLVGRNIGGKWLYSDRFSQPATGEKNPVHLQTENYVEILKKKNWIPSFPPMDEWIIVPAPIVPCSPTLSDFPSTASIHPADS